MPSNTYEYLLLQEEAGILTLTLNRPQVLNALNLEVLLELDQALDEISQSDSIRAVIVTGAGEKAFVAGADIAQMQKLTVQEARAFAQQGMRTLTRFERIPQPTIAAINGYALGGGCELALACDIRIASRTAKLGQPEVNLGIIPGFGGTQRLPRLVGMGVAKELLFTGDLVDAQRALAIGLVNHVTEPAELLPFAVSLAKRIASKGPFSLSLCKQAVNEGNQMDLDRALLYETELFSLAFSSEEQPEGMAAFLEKRAPDFNRR